MRRDVFTGLASWASSACPSLERPSLACPSWAFPSWAFPSACPYLHREHEGMEREKGSALKDEAILETGDVRRLNTLKLLRKRIFHLIEAPCGMVGRIARTSPAQLSRPLSTTVTLSIKMHGAWYNTAWFWAVSFLRVSPDTSARLELLGDFGIQSSDTLSESRAVPGHPRPRGGT